MIFLITGGAGFIGSHLAFSLIKAGHTVRILDDLSSGFETNIPTQAAFIKGSVTNADNVNKAMQDIDGCFHLAAISSVEKSRTKWAECSNVNINGAVRIFANAAKYKIPVVYASSAAVYGALDKLPLEESAELKPISTYGADKLAVEIQAQAAAHSQGLLSAGIRIFNCYGLRQRADDVYGGAISLFTNLLQQHKPIKIYGDGKQTRDFISVKDVVQVLTRSMDLLKNRQAQNFIINAATGNGVEIKQLVQILADLLTVKAQITYAPRRPGEILHSLGSTKLAQEITDWKAKVDLGQGLTELLKTSF